MYSTLPCGSESAFFVVFRYYNGLDSAVKDIPADGRSFFALEFDRIHGRNTGEKFLHVFNYDLMNVKVFRSILLDFFKYMEGTVITSIGH